jgi:RNA polymerase sigma-70 factor (ECF subfamily)
MPVLMGMKPRWNDIDQRQAILLGAARDGDQDAFHALVGPHRSALHAHCYRMLGSVHDAEDALQEVLLRAWRGLASFEGRSSLRAWLHRIVTNACLNMIDSRSRRILPVDRPRSADHDRWDEPRGEQWVEQWIEPYPWSAGGGDVSTAPGARYEQRESLELAFVAALQYLPPNQRAALILRDVLGFSARDAAETLGATTTSMNSALQHARRNVEARIPAESQQTTLRVLGDDRMSRLVEQYMRALEEADVAAMIELLAEDATWSMPPFAEWFRGRAEIEAFLRSGPFMDRWRHVPTQANGQVAVACYAWDDASGCYAGRIIDVLTVDRERITAVTAFVDQTLFPRLGLPPVLAA